MWAASASSPTTSPTRSPPARWWSGPASVVKELLENSLDAGAPRPADRGRKRRAPADPRRRRRLRHAARRRAAGLRAPRHQQADRASRTCSRISTLGFRGEALPSIASVSRLVLETRARRGSHRDARRRSRAARCCAAEEAALAPGTTVTVRDLFYNVPARKKFLRSEQTELAHIASLVTHYSLAHPDKTFLLRQRRQGAAERHAGGDAARARLPGVRQPDAGGAGGTGPRARAEAAAASAPRGSRRAAASRPPFRLRGFVSRPQVPEAEPQLDLPVRQRPADPRPAAAARHLLGLSQPDAAGLLPVRAAVPGVRLRARWTSTFTPRRPRCGSGTGPSCTISCGTRSAEALVESTGRCSRGARCRRPRAARRRGLPYSEFSQRVEDQSWQPSAARPATEALPEFTPARPAAPRGPLRLQRAARRGRRVAAAQSPDPGHARRVSPGAGARRFRRAWTALADLRPLGQIHESFIIAAGRDGLWIIDQHVAHERILFEKILKQRAAGRVEMQRLLMPLVLQLTPAQQVDYARIAEELEAIGLRDRAVRTPHHRREGRARGRRLPATSRS